MLISYSINPNNNILVSNKNIIFNHQIIKNIKKKTVLFQPKI